jgi:hypothetical protein
MVILGIAYAWETSTKNGKEKIFFPQCLKLIDHMQFSELFLYIPGLKTASFVEVFIK